MGLETGVNYIADLVSANPTGTDPKGQGDDHIRNGKKAVKQSFAGFTGAIMVTGPESGLANAYVLTPVPALPSYVAGMTVTFMAGNANTGASTLNISGLGVKALKSSVGDELLANEISTVGFAEATYDGTRFLLKAPTTEFVQQQALSGVLPGQTGNAGKFLTTNGTSATWAFAGITGYAAKTANYTVAVTDREKLLESTASTAVTYALPAAATAGAQFAFYAQAASAGQITLDPDASELINGASTFVFRAGEGGLVFCDGSAWHVFTGHNTAGEDLAIFGDGSDGDVTITGSVTLSRDMYYGNLTLGSGAALVTAGWRIFVKNTLDLTAAPAGAIQWNGNPGADGVGTTNGAGATSLANGVFSGTTTAAAPGQTGPAPAGSAVRSNGGKGGANGANGDTASTPVAAQTTVPLRRPTVEPPFLPSITGGVAAWGAIMGGGTGTPGATGGGGSQGAGGAANGGGVVAIFARIIARGGSTAAGVIQAKGGLGGSAGASVVVRGASGAGGGGGGWVLMIYRFLTGSSATGAIDVTGGNGGGGGPGTGTGTLRGGDGGSSGEGGRAQVYNLAAGTLTEVTPVASVAGATTATATGASGGAATTSRMAL